MATMNHSLARGYASQLIQNTRNFQSFKEHLDRGLVRRVNDQFDKVCRTKKVEGVARKLQRAAGGELRVQIPDWSRNKSTIVLDTVRSERNAPAYNYFSPDHVRWRESRLLMFTLYCSREGDWIRSYQMSGPSIGRHAITRLLQRGAATPETLRATTRRALERAREAVALLQEEDDIYELLLPFGRGAIAVQVDGSRNMEGVERVPPLLSVRTYLTHEMLSPENQDRILDLEAFYLDKAFSDTDRYRHLLEINRSFMGNVAPEDRPDINDIEVEQIEAHEDQAEPAEIAEDRLAPAPAGAASIPSQPRELAWG